MLSNELVGLDEEYICTFIEKECPEFCKHIAKYIKEKFPMFYVFIDGKKIKIELSNTIEFKNQTAVLLYALYTDLFELFTEDGIDFQITLKKYCLEIYYEDNKEYKIKKQ